MGLYCWWQLSLKHSQLLAGLQQHLQYTVPSSALVGCRRIAPFNFINVFGAFMNPSDVAIPVQPVHHLHSPSAWKVTRDLGRSLHGFDSISIALIVIM